MDNKISVVGGPFAIAKYIPESVTVFTVSRARADQLIRQRVPLDGLHCTVHRRGCCYVYKLRNGKQSQNFIIFDKKFSTSIRNSKQWREVPEEYRKALSDSPSVLTPDFEHPVGSTYGIDIDEDAERG